MKARELKELRQSLEESTKRIAQLETEKQTAVNTADNAKLRLNQVTDELDSLKKWTEFERVLFVGAMTIATYGFMLFLEVYILQHKTIEFAWGYGYLGATFLVACVAFWMYGKVRGWIVASSKLKRAPKDRSLEESFNFVSAVKREQELKVLSEKANVTRELPPQAEVATVLLKETAALTSNLESAGNA